MLIVGEIINTSRKRIAEAVEKQDAAFIGQVAKDQADAGADFIDVNAGTFVDRETEYLCWLVKTVQDAVDLPLCLDSPSPEALSEAVKHHRGEPMINSISLEEDRFQDLLPVITSQPCKVVALCMAQTSMPTTADERVA
ncbi:MAG: dihydropteroate synthase, partial [Desulfobacterales bacterium]|nr:dihydropteroate synthase [Desulfobacterales bacterium]